MSIVHNGRAGAFPEAAQRPGAVVTSRGVNTVYHVGVFDTLGEGTHILNYTEIRACT